MKRKILDLILTGAGAALCVLCLVAGVLLLWGSSFASNEVRVQLARQQVYFPTPAAFAHPTGKEVRATMRPYLAQYAGLQVVTGAQAQAYATHFIAIHLSEMPMGGVYAKVSAAAQAKPTTTQLQSLVQTVFRGTTLRAELLEAYGFSVFGTIAADGAIAAFCIAGLMLILTALGLRHIRRVPADQELSASSLGAGLHPPEA